MADLNFIPDEFSDLSQGELLDRYDDPKNFYITDIALKEINELKPNSFPKHATILLTHGLFTINSDDRKAVVREIERNQEKVHDTLTAKNKGYRLLRNFSDFGTRKIAKYMFISSDWYSKENGANDNEQYEYPENIIIPRVPRIKGDPARDVEANDFQREIDFSGNELLPENYLEGDDSGEKAHKIYHDKIDNRLFGLEKDGKRSITFDVHDTGVRMMDQDPEKDTFREGGYPKMEIGTLAGDSCDPKILDFFITQVEKYFGFTPVVNTKYKGGYVTQRHGRETKKDMGNPNQRNVLQIELGRYLYMKESTQEIDHEQARKVGAALRMCIQKTCEEFGEDFQNAA